jgi:hypothetical protein
MNQEQIRKMKKISLLAIIMLCAGTFCQARQIGETEAMQLAQSFGATATASHLMSASGLSAMTLAYTAQSASQSENLYYVFNRGENSGYVVVAGDDRASSTILGYSDSGTFDMDKAPSNLKAWLDGYGREMEYMAAHPEIVNSKSSTTLTTSVSPLCKSMWDQGAPYNTLCPMYNSTTQCVAGCVATAMAQVMYYHKWPVKGTGSRSYTSWSKKYNLSANFDTTYYRWDVMEPVYNSNSSEAAKAEVAKLVYDCGVSVQMDYGVSSAAQMLEGDRSLVRYFGYDKGISYKLHDYYSKEEWDSIIRNELDNKRPVTYDGFSSSGGHAFVCDGYDNKGYFHFNWGWSGLSNGYFVTSALDPMAQGIGGSSGGFNMRQDISIGIQPPTSNPIAPCDIYADSLISVYKTATIGSSVVLGLKGLYDFGYNDVSFKTAVILKDADGNDVLIQKAFNGNDVAFSSYTGYTTLNASITVPSSVASGTYKAYICYSTDQGATWNQVPVRNMTPKYYVVTVGSGTYKVGMPTEQVPSLKLTGIRLNTKLYYDKEPSVYVYIANSGGDYSGNVYISLVKSTENGDSTAYTSGKFLIDVAHGDTATVNFNEKITAEPGSYKFCVLDRNSTKIDGDSTVEVAYASSSSSNLRATSNPSLLKDGNGKVPKNDVEITIGFKNLGGYYSGLVYGMIFANGASEYSSLIGPVEVMLDYNQSKTYQLKGEFMNGITDGGYYVVMYDYTNQKTILRTTNSQAKTFFTLGDEWAGIEKISTAGSTMIYPNPATDALNVVSVDAVSRASVFSLTGSLLTDRTLSSATSFSLDVASLPAGVYMLRLVTTKGTTVNRFVKK